MKYTYRILFIASLFIGCTSNDEADEPETGIPFNSAGPISGSAGLNSFTFGAATAAAQIEEPVPESDWYLYTPAPDGLALEQTSIEVSKAIAERLRTSRSSKNLV